MRFDLKKPCSNCPFRIRGGIRLRPDRAEEIAYAAIANPGGTFPCHKTTIMVDDDLEEGPDTQYCAGALIFAHKLDSLNQMMRVAERLNLWDGRTMQDQDAVFDSLDEMFEAQQ